MKKFFALLLALAMIFTLAACGEKPADDAATPDDATPETVTYTVLTNATFPPFDTIDPDSGEVVGFDMDLIAAIGQDQGFEVEFVDMAFEALIPAIETGNGDIIAAGMWSGDPERQAKVDFSESYFKSGSVLLVKADNDVITGMESLTADMKVATQIGTDYSDKLDALVKEGKLGQAVILDGFDTCVLQLKNGDVDAMMAGVAVVNAYSKKDPDTLKMAGDVSALEDYGFAVQKGNAELLEKINTGLANVKENGVYDQLLEKWELN